MAVALFKNGVDTTTFAPFKLFDELASKWTDVRLSFDDWTWFDEEVDDYYMNGYGIEGLVKACLFVNGVNPDDEGIHYNSEANTCYIHFKDLELANRAAQWAAVMANDKAVLNQMITVAREEGFED